MRRIPLLALAALACGATTHARATDVYVVVGTLGYDVQRDALPPLDVAVGEACVYQELDVADLIELVREGGVLPAALAPGAYEAAVLEAGDACGGAPVVTGRADVPASPLPEQSVARTAGLVIAALDANGAPKLRSFNLDTSPIGGRRGRITLYHAAAAPPLDLRLRRTGRTADLLVATGLANGHQSFPADLPGTSYELVVSPASAEPGAFEKAIARFDLALDGDRSHAAVLIGSLARGTFDLLTFAAPTAP